MKLDFQSLLKVRAATRASFTVDLIAIDVAGGDLTAGIMLALILDDWGSPEVLQCGSLARDARIVRDGRKWQPTPWSGWFRRARIGKHAARRALHVLRDRGLLELRVFQTKTVPKAPVLHLSVNEEAVHRDYLAVLSGRPADGSDLQNPE